MANAKLATMSGRDHFAGIYRDELDLEAKWLQFGAKDKADSIELLLVGNGIEANSIVELGCGTGAVITECRRRGLGRRHVAIDYSDEAIAYLRDRTTGIECITADINDATFALDETFDVVVVSHVLEHLEDPLSFLRSLQQRLRFRYLIAEVPLEDLPIARIKARIRDRTRNTAGHVQFFTSETFGALIRTAGFSGLDSRNYAPVMSAEVLDFVSQKDGLSRSRKTIKKLLNGTLPRWLGAVWRKNYYAHEAVLCVSRSADG